MFNKLIKIMGFNVETGEETLEEVQPTEEVKEEKDETSIEEPFDLTTLPEPEQTHFKDWLKNNISSWESYNYWKSLSEQN